MSTYYDNPDPESQYGNYSAYPAGSQPPYHQQGPPQPQNYQSPPYQHAQPPQPGQLFQHSAQSPTHQNSYPPPQATPAPQQGYHPPYQAQHDPFQPSSTPTPAPILPPSSSNYAFSNSQSHPMLPVSPPPMSMSPQGPRVRYDSNSPYAQSTTPAPMSQGIYMADPRMSSPPPLVQHSSSNTSFYPPNPLTHSHSGLGQPDDQDDNQPLLHRQGTPGYQLSDAGYAGQGSDVGGAMPGGWGHNDDDDHNVHYGPLPGRVPRRNKTQKKVRLFNGNLVMDVDVPSMLLDQCPERTGNEFTQMRYTAATCDPNDFESSGYTLRQKFYDPPRSTELFIVITMYNEDDKLFCRTMRGVMQNIAHLCSRTKSRTWGKDGWKKVVVCVVADGRFKINPRTRSVLAALGVYQDGVAKNVVNGKPVTAHIYEYTTQLHVGSNLKVGPGGSQYPPVQMIFCLKERNQKKINSHRWFFNAFSETLMPNVCVLLDVGTQPGSDSIYHLWKSFDLNSSVGGACGEIVALKGKVWKNLLNPLVAAQNFEYKMSNILDKPLESAFGYITVLPGAFSAYRYIAIKNDAKGEGPLKQYFIGESMHGADAGIFSANMYLAEDRILCWELVSKRGCQWTLHYVKSAYAITDVPDGVPELVSQRRRWLNGSFFAAIHSVVHFGYLYRSNHSFGRKFFLHIELVYQTFNLIFSWFSLGNFYIAFIVLTNSMESYSKTYKYINIPLQYMYLGLLLLCFLLSMGNRPAGSKMGYTMSMVGFALITCYMIFAAVFLAVNGIKDVEAAGGVTAATLFTNSIFRNIILSLAATYGLYILASILALDPWHLLTSFLQYLLIAPSYINVLKYVFDKWQADISVYAFSNVHDVSWGTKGSDKVSEDLGVVKPAGKDSKDVLVDLPIEQKDINDAYMSEVKVLQEKTPKEVTVVSPEQKQEDYYKTFRTNVLLAWTISNGALCAAILSTSAGSTKTAVYMGILLYSVAGLAAFRFLGSTVYLVVRLFAGE